MLKRLFLLCSLTSLLVGCAELLDNQTPAPVYGNGTPLYGNKPLETEPSGDTGEPTSKAAKETTDSAKTAPLKNTPKEIKAERLPAGERLLTPEQEKELSELQNPSVLEPEETSKPKVKTEKKPEPEPQPEQVVEAPAPTPAETKFQPLESFSPMSPAVSTLVLAANADTEKGNVDAASNTLERASRIEPRNASLYYKMALLKLKSKPNEAENLAKKSALLAANDASLKKHSWLLVAKARELQKDLKGAQEARAKASKY